MSFRGTQHRLTSASLADPTQQLLEFARTGRLEATPAAASDPWSRILMPVLGSAACLSSAITIGAVAFTQGVQPLMSIAGVAIAILGVVLAGVARSRIPHKAPTAVHVKAGAILPPDLVRVGNWIRRDGAWLRVEQVAKLHTGGISVLLSDQSVVDLRHPVTIAGDDFRPSADTFAALR